MTAPEQDPVRAFRHALGHRLDAQLNTTHAVVALVHAAVTNHGWTPEQLAKECGRDLGDTYKPGGVITERLRKAATHPPIDRDHAPALGPKRPFCSPECRDNAGWVLDDDRHPIRRCDCRSSPCAS